MSLVPASELQAIVAAGRGAAYGALQDGKDMVFWTLNGVPYPLIQITFAEYLWLVQTPGFTAYPQNYATDTSLNVYTTPVLYVWPPSSLQTTPLTIYYQRSMPDITTPETSATVPWFPNSTVLQRSVAGRLMGITGDQRMEQYIGDDPEKFPICPTCKEIYEGLRPEDPKSSGGDKP
jgi:hypothetical protein